MGQDDNISTNQKFRDYIVNINIIYVKFNNYNCIFNIKMKKNIK